LNLRRWRRGSKSCSRKHSKKHSCSRSSKKHSCSSKKSSCSSKKHSCSSKKHSCSRSKKHSCSRGRRARLNKSCSKSVRGKKTLSKSEDTRIKCKVNLDISRSKSLNKTKCFKGRANASKNLKVGNCKPVKNCGRFDRRH